ncbi:hypothetical protein MC885_014207, partial [Smutsia gigantea]
MVAKQRIRMANEKHSKNITQRGNVAKTLGESPPSLAGGMLEALSSPGEPFCSTTEERLSTCIRPGIPAPGAEMDDRGK